MSYSTLALIEPIVNRLYKSFISLIRSNQSAWDNYMQKTSIVM